MTEPRPPRDPALRQYMAAAALSGVLASPRVGGLSAREAAGAALEYADAACDLLAESPFAGAGQPPPPDQAAAPAEDVRDLVDAAREMVRAYEATRPVYGLAGPLFVLKAALGKFPGPDAPPPELKGRP